MYTDFESLPGTARVWVYQASRPLTDIDVTLIEQALQPALREWAAHGQPLLSSAQVVEKRFVVVGVDEGYNLPSGCSIDASVRTLRTIGQQINVDFFDRSAAVRSAEGGVVTYPLPVLKAAVADGLISVETWVFNTLVQTKAELREKWQIRAADSWLKRYFKPTIV